MDSYWNYRVVCHNHGTNEEYYTIQEIYYFPKSEKTGFQDKHHMQPHAPIGVDLDELQEEVKCMLKAFEKPVLQIKNERLVDMEENEK